MRTLTSVILVLAGCTLDTDASSTPAAVESQALQDATAATQEVMVYLKEQASLDVTAYSKVERRAQLYGRLVTHAEATQASVLALLDGADYQAFHITNAILVRNATSQLVTRLSAHPAVARVASNRSIPLRLPPKSTNSLQQVLAGAEPGLVATGADRVWSELGVKGAGIVVAGQDTGVDWTHPALKAKYRGWDGTTADHRYSWHDAVHAGSSPSNPCGYDLAQPCDDDQHGTHTMGTIVGDDGAGNQIGMAPDAKWIACRNMDAGAGKPSSYIECFEWFLAPYPQGGDPRIDGDPTKAPDVVNNSWGCPDTEGCMGDEIVPAIHALAAAGVVIVASAGNEGPGCSSIGAQPATDTADTLSVGAYSVRNGAIASFSSRGPSTLDSQLGPLVTAPGVGIRSSVPGGGFEDGWSGTSMAGPHVTGEVALILSAAPALKGKPAEVIAVVRSHSNARTSNQTCGGISGRVTPNNTWGYGTIDAFAAVQSVLVPVP